MPMYELFNNTHAKSYTNCINNKCAYYNIMGENFSV